MMSCSKTSKLGRKRQEPSSRSKMSLCRLFCNNSYRVTTTALKNLLWHRRDENTDTEVIGLSRWIYGIHRCRHKLSPVFDRAAHRTSRDPTLNGPVALPSSGMGTVTAWMSQPASSPHLAGSHTHGEVAELKSKYCRCQKVSSKHIISLNMFFLSICPVATKGKCVYDCKREGFVTMQEMQVCEL